MSNVKKGYDKRWFEIRDRLMKEQALTQDDMNDEATEDLINRATDKEWEATRPLRSWDARFTITIDMFATEARTEEEALSEMCESINGEHNLDARPEMFTCIKSRKIKEETTK